MDSPPLDPRREVLAVLVGGASADAMLAYARSAGMEAKRPAFSLVVNSAQKAGEALDRLQRIVDAASRDGVRFVCAEGGVGKGGVPPYSTQTEGDGVYTLVLFDILFAVLVPALADNAKDEVARWKNAGKATAVAPPPPPPAGTEIKFRYAPLVALLYRSGMLQDDTWMVHNGSPSTPTTSWAYHSRTGVHGSAGAVAALTQGPLADFISAQCATFDAMCLVTADEEFTRYRPTTVSKDEKVCNFRKILRELISCTDEPAPRVPHGVVTRSDAGVVSQPTPANALALVLSFVTNAGKDRITLKYDGYPAMKTDRLDAVPRTFRTWIQKVMRPSTGFGPFRVLGGNLGFGTGVCDMRGGNHASRSALSELVAAVEFCSDTVKDDDTRLAAASMVRMIGHVFGPFPADADGETVSDSVKKLCRKHADRNLTLSEEADAACVLASPSGTGGVQDPAAAVPVVVPMLPWRASAAAAAGSSSSSSSSSSGGAAAYTHPYPYPTSSSSSSSGAALHMDPIPPPRGENVGSLLLRTATSRAARSAFDALVRTVVSSADAALSPGYNRGLGEEQPGFMNHDSLEAFLSEEGDATKRRRKVDASADASAGASAGAFESEGEGDGLDLDLDGDGLEGLEELDVGGLDVGGGVGVGGDGDGDGDGGGSWSGDFGSPF